MRRLRNLVILVVFLLLSCNTWISSFLLPPSCKMIKDDKFSAGTFGYTSHAYHIKGNIDTLELKKYPLQRTLLTFSDDVLVDNWKPCSNIENHEGLNDILETLVFYKCDSTSNIINLSKDILKRKDDYYFVSYYKIDQNINSKSLGEKKYYNMYFLDLRERKLYDFLWGF